MVGCDGHFNVVQGLQLAWIILNPRANEIPDPIIFSIAHSGGPGPLNNGHCGFRGRTKVRPLSEKGAWFMLLRN